jgi:nitrogen fixation protein NifB
VLTPPQAIGYLERVTEALNAPISVVGIAGPGDPFANAPQTMQTLRLVRQRYPEMLLCVASNGLAIGEHIPELAQLQTTHVTITINAVDPAIGQKIYRFVRPGKQVYRGLTGAQVLLGRQLDAVRQLHEQGMTVKINTVVIPGVNDHHVAAIAETAASLGADTHNCMPMVPVADTPFADLPEPAPDMMRTVRDEASAHLPQMAHCRRCRADAAGKLGEANDTLINQVLSDVAGELEPMAWDEHEARRRPNVAVASFEGALVNQHLGASEQLWVFGADEGGGYRSIETRPTPIPGSGDERWVELARRLHDCRALICSSAGRTPQRVLARHGVRVLVAEGLIGDALEAVYAGRKPRMPARVLRPEANCDDDGVGCGGCTGTGTGCG